MFFLVNVNIFTNVRGCWCDIPLISKHIEDDDDLNNVGGVDELKNTKKRVSTRMYTHYVSHYNIHIIHTIHIIHIIIIPIMYHILYLTNNIYTHYTPIFRDSRAFARVQIPKPWVIVIAVAKAS